MFKYKMSLMCVFYLRRHPTHGTAWFNTRTISFFVTCKAALNSAGVNKSTLRVNSSSSLPFIGLLSNIRPIEFKSITICMENNSSHPAILAKQCTTTNTCTNTSLWFYEQSYFVQYFWQIAFWRLEIIRYTIYFDSTCKVNNRVILKM